MMGFMMGFRGKGIVSGFWGLGCVNTTNGIDIYNVPLRLSLFILTIYSGDTETLYLSSGIGSEQTTRVTAYSSETGID